MIKNKDYLGDAVYADFDGYGVILTTENGDHYASNRIYLEPDVLDNLIKYRNRLFEKERVRHESN